MPIDNRPVPVDSKTFRLRPPTPCEGSATNIHIMHRHTGRTMIVDRADIPELIADLQAAYQL